MKAFKILCIDGGGIKGLYSAQVLAEFEEAFHTNISDHFDLVCGTSTGGILALGVAAGIPMADVVKFYEENGPSIFAQKRKICCFCGKNIGDAFMSLKQALCMSKYSSVNLQAALVKVFGSKKIKESKNLLCIPAYNITAAMPRVFKKDYGHLNQDDEKQFVDVALATAAAPTYFPIKEIDSVQYVDGGLYANDPIVVALTEAVFKGYWIKKADERSEDDYDSVQILSVSSCELPAGDFAKKLRRSFLGWKDTLFDAYSEGQTKQNRFFIEQIKEHLDFDVKIERIVNGPVSGVQANEISMDNASASAMKLLKAIGSITGNEAKNRDFVKKIFSESKSVVL